MARKSALVVVAAILAGAACNKKELEDARIQLAEARAGLSRATGESGKLRADLAAMDKERSEAQAKLDAAEKARTDLETEIAKVRETLRAAEETAAEAGRKNERTATELAAAHRKAEEATKRLADVEGKVSRLEEAAAAKEREIASARSERDAAAARLREFEARPAQPAEAPPVAYAGSESIPAHQALPVTFPAKAGTVLQWSWKITAAPDGLSVDGLDFAVVGPDGGKAHSIRAGLERKDDAGRLPVTADGRWTLYWFNRVPKGDFTIEFEASLVPGS